MPTAALVYPHPVVAGADTASLVGDPLFFRQYASLKQKLMLHRESMEQYAPEVLTKARYIDAHRLARTGDVAAHLTVAKCDAVRVIDPNDAWLLARLSGSSDTGGGG